MRRQRGLSQAQLAHPELSDSYVSLIESGKRTPTPAVLELLAQKLDCSLSYLVNGVTAEQMEDIELALGYARLAFENGEVVEARSRYAELIADNNLTGLTALRQDVQFGLALATEACGDLDEAARMLEALRTEELAADRRLEAASALVRVYRTSGRLTEAVEAGEAILFGAERPAWSDLVVELGANLLGVYYVRGDLLRARQYAAELLNAADTLGTPRSMVAASWNAAVVAEAVGHGEEALNLAERALAVQSESGYGRNLARMRLTLAALTLRVRPHAADEVRAAVARTVRELNETSASTLDRGNCLLELARAELVGGHLDTALAHAAEGRDLIPGTARLVEAEAHLLLSRAYTGLGRSEEASAEISSVRAWLSPLPDAEEVASTWYAAAEGLEQIGETEAAVGAYQRALTSSGL
ncbi:helix-turn-helix transcriptional regulator [Nonomuraea longicatena]|uniref:helix-turn-helix transcriptional regulator n=1 Tax=Nonomuraea longicatena TaxID=83682 RepID=UPI0031E3D544